MPSLMALLVSLSEILESQGQPCKELEIWALLCRCAETLQDLIIKGEAVSSNGFRYMLTPNNLLVKDNGNVTIGAAPESFQGSLYMAPEFDSFSVQNLSETAFEKMFVYSLGRTLQVASEFGLKQNEVLNISYDLNSLLQTMTERDATVRIGLIHILEACALQSTQHSTKPSPSHILSHLYKIVLDSKHKTLSWDSSCGSDYNDQNQTQKRPGRVRRPRPQVRHRRTLGHSFSSRSRSRSGSHSPSRSRSQESERFGGSRLNWPRTAATLPATSILASSSNLLTKPVTSSVSEKSGSFLRSRVIQIPSSSASHFSQGLLSLRQGRPAFQKYVQLKERQIRLQQARNGKSQSAMENVRSRLISQELMDKTSETVSMASLMSYTLGSYMPYLYNQQEAERSSIYGRDYETDVESVLDSQRSLDQGQGDKVEMYRGATKHEVSDVNTSSMSAEAFDPSRTEITKEGSLKIIETGERNISLKVEPKSGKRQYWGPEFVHKARKPEIKVAMPFQNNAKNTTHVYPVTVVHLTGQKFEITLDPGTTGRQVLDAVISYTDLDDFLFFGLTYISVGDEYRALETRFTREGKGRRPDITPPPLVNKVLVQLWDIMLHRGHEQKKVVEWFEYLYGGNKVNGTDRLRHVMATTYDRARELEPQGHQVLSDFLDLPYNVSPVTDALSDGEHFFLDDETKLHKIAPKGWKEVSKTPYSFVRFTLYVRVKFYPEVLTDFRHKSSIHLLYLQLRRDIVEGNVECEDLSLYKLAGMALQVEYGDYDQISCVQAYFQAEQYVPKAALKKLGSSFIYKRVTEEHEACFGTQSSDAEITFIKHVMRLPGYGIHFYKLFKFKSQVNQFVWIGLSQYNLVLSDIDGSKGTIVQAYPWNRIMKISFNKCRFSIQPNVEVAKGKPPKLNFYTKSHRKGRYMLQFSLDQHRFQIRMRTRSSNMETFAGEMRSDYGPLHVDAGVGHGERDNAYANASVMADTSQQLLRHEEDDEEEEEIEEENDGPVFYKLPHPYQSPPPYQPPSMVEILVDHLILPGMNEIALDAHVANSNNTAWNYPEMNKVLEMSFRTTSLDSALASERSAQEEVPLVESSQIPHSGRHIFKVMLEREEKFGIGLTIVGGETTNSLDLGIFIKSVAPGGPAAQDGRVKPGDRLIAIDGLSLEGKQHHEAVALIRDAGPKVELLISQIRPPGTLKQIGIPKYQADFEKKTRSFTVESSKTNSLLPERDRMALENSSHSETQACFNYDDFFKEAHHIDLMTSDACISDEDNHHITCNSTPPPPALPSQPPPTSLRNFPDRYQEHFFCHTDALRSSAYDNPVDGTSSPKYFSLKREKQEKDNVTADQAFCELRLDHELSYHIGTEWSNCSEDHSTYFYQGRLTEAEKEDIQTLGDIAALDVEASSSDSDFDTAVKNTLEGSGLNKHSKTSSEAFSIKAIENPTRNNLQDVIYEVILERQNGPYGIVIETSEHSKDSANSLFIKEIFHGSSAHLGDVLAPGDKIIEIQGQSVANMSQEEAYAVLESAKEFCAVKISRAAYIDERLSHRPGMKHQLKNDSGLDSGLTHFTEHAGSLSYGLKPANKSTKTIQSSPSLSRSHLIPSLLKETTKHQDIDLNIVLPPAASILLAEDSESNTQSDVDSDVLDSSRSELEAINKYSQQFLGDEPEENLRVCWNESGTTTQTEEMNSSHVKQCQIEANMATDVDESKVQNYVAVSPRDCKVTLIPDESYLIEKDVSLRTDVSHSCNSSSRDITDNMDEIGTNPAKSANKDEFSLEERATDFQERETANKIDEKRAGDKNENGKTKDIVESVDKLPGGGLQEANGDVSQVNSHSELEDKIKDLEEDGNRKSEVSRYQRYNPELVEATLIREPGGSFGFTIAGDLTTGGCYIKHLVSSPLAQHGTLFPGDKLLMVNSEDTTSLNHIEAVSLLRNGPDEVKLKLLRYPSSMQTQENLLIIKNLIREKDEKDIDLVSNVSSALDSHSSVHDLIKSLEKKTNAIITEPYEDEQTRNKTSASRSRSISLSQDNTGGTVEVLPKMREGHILKSQSKEIEKKWGTESIPEEKFKMIKIDLRKPSQLGSNLGISLVDKEIDGQNMVVIKKLKPNGIAHKDGRLQPGDILLQANNTPLVKAKAQEVVEVLRKSKDKVLLTLSRLKDRTQIIGSEKTQNTDGFYENSDPVDSPEDDPIIGRREAADISEVYTSCRTLPVNVPLIMSNEWLSDLPLISLPKPKSYYATSILQSLVDMVERGEPTEEFKNIRQTKGDRMCNVGQLPENKLKNRYRNILPYDSNRVRLMNTLEGDYINASHISVSLANVNDTLKYIVCQGPLEETVDDFWKMLWQEKVNVIAMLTQAVERDKIKCHVYWPQRKGESLTFFESRLQVKLIRSYALQSFDVIQLAVEEIPTGTKRKLTMLQYTRWPDQGAPDTALPILQLLQVLHLFENGRPPVIHCSAGVGRTGVVIATDIALACIETELEVDLYQIVCSLRSQRQGMIQTTDQYAFCYTACMEAILSDEMQET